MSNNKTNNACTIGSGNIEQAKRELPDVAYTPHELGSGIAHLFHECKVSRICGEIVLACIIDFDGTIALAPKKDDTEYVASLTELVAGIKKPFQDAGATEEEIQAGAAHLQADMVKIDALKGGKGGMEGALDDLLEQLGKAETAEGDSNGPKTLH